MKNFKALRFIYVVLCFFILTKFEIFGQVFDFGIDYPSRHYKNSVIEFENDLLKLSEFELINFFNFSNLPNEEKAIIQKAINEFYDGRSDFAIRVLNKAIDDNPRSFYIPYFYIYISYFHFEKGEFNKAEKNFHNAYKTSNELFEILEDSSFVELGSKALFWQSLTLLKIGRVDDSKQLLQECFRNYPKSKYADESLYLLGVISEMKNEGEQAISFFKTLQRNYPRSNLILISLLRESNNYLKLGQDVQALVSLDLAESIYFRIQRKDSIGVLYEKQDFIEDFLEKVDFMRGEAYTSSKRYNQAISQFESFIEKYPTSKYIFDAKLAVAWGLLNKGDFIPCLEYSTKLLEELPDSLKLQKDIVSFFIGICNQRLGRLQEAQNFFSELSVRPNYPFVGEALFQLGLIYYEKKDYTSARKAFERSLRESNDNSLSAKIHLMLGATYLEMKNWANAVAEYKKCEDILRRATQIQIPNKNWMIVECRLKQSIAQIYDFRNSEAIQNLLFVVGNFPNDPRCEDAYFWLSEAYYRLDMLRNAIDNYEILLTKFPNTRFREDALYGLGWSYFRLKNFKRANDVFGTLAKEFPESKYSSEIWLRQGDGFFILKDFKNAIESYQKVISLKPRSDEAEYAHYQICHSYYKLGQLNNAYDEVLNFIKKYPNSPFAPNAMYLNGWIRFQQKNYQEAINNFLFLIDAYPNSLLVPRAKYAIGDALYNLGRYEEAIGQYKEIIDNFPTSPLVPDALRSIQFCYIALGDETKAIQIADEYITQNPQSPFSAEFAFKKGEMLFVSRRYSDAISELETYLQKFKEPEKKIEAIYLIAKSYESLGDYPNATKYYQLVYQSYPNSDYAPLSLLQIGLIYRDNAKISEADSVFSLLRKTYPDDPSCAQAGFEQATIKFNTGDTVRAIEIWKDIAEKFEGTEFADQSIYRLAMYYRTMGNLKEAVNQFLRIINTPNDPNLAAEAQFRIGEIYQRVGNCEKAIEWYTKQINEYAGIEDWYTLALLNLGDCYEKNEDFENAINAYRAIIATRTPDDYVATAKRRISFLEKRIKK